MFRKIKLIPLIVLAIAICSSSNSFAQSKNKKKVSGKRETERRAMHSRDSLMRSLNKSDTSISSLLQRVEQYTTSFNQIINNLADGLDTADISQQLPPVIKRIDRINIVTKTHKSSTLRYLAVLRDNLDHVQGKLDGWQADLDSVNEKLVQNQNDLLKFSRDSSLNIVPTDSLVRKTFLTQLNEVRLLWRQTDSINRRALFKVNLLQDKLSVSYTKTLDETDQIDSKIKGFARKALSGECGYIWKAGPRYADFKSALNNTIRLNGLLFNYFINNETAIHLTGLLFLILIFSWIIYSRTKVLKSHENPRELFKEAKYVFKNPVISSLLVVTTITPYFYDHPPMVFLETFFLVSVILSFILIRKEVPETIFNFLISLFVLAIGYAISNLFIEISNTDRYAILVLSILSIISGLIFYKKIKKAPDNHLPYTCLVLKIFIGLQVLSLLLNVTGRFSLAKIIGVTAVFNSLFLVVLYLVVNIIIQTLFLQFQIKRAPNHFINWVDYNLVQKKSKNTLLTAATLLWLFFLLQNLNIDDWAADNITNLLNQPRTIGGASFTFGGFVVFILVIWLSSIASRSISYLYDISTQRVTDLSALKKKNQTSALIIRIGVFSIGFLLAVAASGFPLDKLTIIISAFGVGIGFGLQNIVNNLVSGLILAFEKPVQIGDFIEVSGKSGIIKEIGIRSSKLLTEDGSEVIIPNGDFISQHVTNWTLSNSHRRIELIVGVAYGSDILKVQAILNKVLTENTEIMQAPAPGALLFEFNESSVDFKLLFWVPDNSKRNLLKSNLISLVYIALANAGIEIPYPKRDVQVFFPESTGAEIKVSDALKDALQKKNPSKENPSGQAL